MRRLWIFSCSVLMVLCRHCGENLPNSQVLNAHENSRCHVYRARKDDILELQRERFELPPFPNSLLGQFQQMEEVCLVRLINTLYYNISSKRVLIIL